MKRVCVGSAAALAFILTTASSLTVANTLTANIADYNAAKLAGTDGVITVPANVATYTVNGASTLNVGTSLIVTLPSGFTFGSAPSLTTTGTSTFTLVSGGVGSQAATFQIGTAALTDAQSASLATFVVDGATALETLTPVADALPLTMQAVGTDTTPLSVGAFASEPGIQVVYVGAIQFIDQASPSLGTLFGTGVDSATIVTSAIAISTQVRDTATSSAPVLNPDGTANTTSPSDTATVSIGGHYYGYVAGFSSSTSDCLTPISTGSVTPDAIIVPDVALNVEVFFCATTSGQTKIPYNAAGFVPVVVTPGTSTDFFSAPVNVEFPGLIACDYTSGVCIRNAFGTPSVISGNQTSLTFTLDNSGGSFVGSVASTGVGFTDNLQSMTVASPNGLDNTCGGTVTAVPGSSSISVSGVSLAAGATCTITVDVHVVGSGTVVNTVGPVISDQAPAGGGFASAQVSITAAPNNVPALDVRGLLALALALALLAAFGIRNAPRMKARE